MLRVNVGLSRKLSKDYNSTGFSINLDGEVTASTSDAEAVVEQVKELFDLAEEALDQQIERAQSETAIAGRDEERPTAPTNGVNGRSKPVSNGHSRLPPENGNGHSDDIATNKQINYLLSIGKRQRLSTIQLENRIAEILGRVVGLYELSKRDAARVIDELTATVTNGRARQ
jgi:hypothetical protein